jgi:hypothetical protein
MPRTQQFRRVPPRRICAVGWSVGGSSWPPGPRKVIPDSQYQKAPAESISCHSPWGGGWGYRNLPPVFCLLSPVSFFSDATQPSL